MWITMESCLRGKCGNVFVYNIIICSAGVDTILNFIYSGNIINIKCDCSVQENLNANGKWNAFR